MTTGIQHPLHPLSWEQQRGLMAGLNPNRISNRSQSGRQLSYLEAWDVKAALIRVFGFGGFSATADEMRTIAIERVPKVEGRGDSRAEKPIEYENGEVKFGTANYRVTASVRVTLTIHQLGAVYSEYAASSQTGPDLGEVSDFAIKTAESDALKRAAIYLGTQFGLSLYNSASTSDIVGRVLAEEQKWPRPNPNEDPEERAKREERERRVDAALSTVEASSEEARPADVPGSITGQAVIDHLVEAGLVQQGTGRIEPPTHGGPIGADAPIDSSEMP